MDSIIISMCAVNKTGASSLSIILNLNSSVINSEFLANLGSMFQGLLGGIRENMQGNRRSAYRDAPDVDIMDIDDTIALAEVLREGINVDFSRGGFHEDIQAVSGDRDAGTEHNNREDEGADRINHFDVRMGVLEEVNDQRGDDDSERLQDISQDMNIRRR